jgi:hypothetical protein
VSSRRTAARGRRNRLAVRCHQTSGGQFIDVGIVDIVPARAR